MEFLTSQRIEVALVSKTFWEKMVVWLVAIVGEFSIQNLTPGVVVNFVTAENTEFERHCSENFLQLFDIVIEKSRTEFK